ncbi:MAG: YraN family protein [Phycisphaerae bacterium]|nr:YraN family protein [Phycisphaerae bacterium]
MADPGQIGRKGEKLARRHLKRQGYRILAKNYRCPAGEIDVIALDGRTIAFVEVKTRQGQAQADPEDTVTASKRRKLYQVARYWLAQRRADNYGCRFDVVAVTLQDEGKPLIRHTPGAFEPPRR